MKWIQWSLHPPQTVSRTPLFWIMVLSLWGHSQSFALEIPRGWRQSFDSRKRAQIFQPNDSSSDILIKYYPKEPLNRDDIIEYLDKKLSISKAPRGAWLDKGRSVRDKANYAHGVRGFRQTDSTVGYLHAVAVTIDREYARLAIMLVDEASSETVLAEQGFQILSRIYATEKSDAAKEGRKKDIERAPPKIDGLKPGGAIKPGRYIGSKTRNQKVKRHFEVMLYETGEYEFLLGYGKSGYTTYSQATGRLNLYEDFFNNPYNHREEFCVYGKDEKHAIHMIYAENEYDRYRLNWVGPVDRLSPRQSRQLERLKNAGKEGYQYVTQPGEGIKISQIETILYTYVDNYYGGIETDEAIYLLMKDGRVRDGLPVAPDRLDVAKSQSREPGYWGWWEKDDQGYSFAWNIERRHYTYPKGTQMKSIPIPRGTRLQGNWGASSSFSSLDFSSVSFWGIQLSKNGRFRKYRNNSMQGGGSATGLLSNMPMITTYSDDEGSVTSVIGSNVGGGTSYKNNRPDSDRIGSYEFDGYTLMLNYDNGVESVVTTFATDDEFRGIWFNDGRLYLKD